MTKTISPPRSPRGSSYSRRHPSPSTDRYPAIHSSGQRLPERPNIPLAAISSSSVTSSIYSNTSSPVSPGLASYPPILQDRPQLIHAVSDPATMAPSTAVARHNSSLAFDLMPASTPTGRISKAKKGKRVHACEFPGCNKVFTRAEHRRRHELNHNPDATFQCRHPGCNKSFHRVDLLQRHQERHDLEGPDISPAHRRHPSQSSAYADVPSSMPPSSMTSPQITESAPRSSAGGMTISSLLHPPTSTYATDMSNPFGIQGVGPFMPWSTAGEDQLFYASDSSPLMDRHHHHHHHRPSISSTSSVAGFELAGSVSPMVTASMPSNWMPASAPPNNLPSSMFGEEYASSSTANPMPIPLSDLDGLEWTFIRRELSTVPGLLSSPSRAGLCDDIRWHCLELYWSCFHPTFPIVHRPTFLPTKPSPLLACAMVAIGSYYDEEGDSKTYSLALLEIATKILQRRPNITSRSRIVDLQTVVLLEVLSTFCARQISVQMSTRFRALFANLNQAHHWLTTSPLAVFRTLKPDRSSTELTKAHKFFVEHETRSRILHACSVLDSQQAMLFEQSHTIRRHTGLRINTAGTLNTANNIHLPCDDDLWDASPVDKWAELAEPHKYRKMPQARPTSPKTAKGFSFFQQQVASCNSDPSTTKSPASTKTKPLVSAGSGQVGSLLNHHITEMCQHTPVRNLLIVTGESWILGRKVEKEAEFHQAKQAVRKWLETATTSKRAIGDTVTAHWHALKILRCLVNFKKNSATASQPDFFGTTNMMHENWSVYLACLICWIRGHRDNSVLVPANAGSSSNNNNNDNSNIISGNYDNTISPLFSSSTQLSILSDPLHAAVEAHTYLTFAEANTSSPTALRDLDSTTLARTQGLLETVRNEKIDKCMMGGLMNDASQILFKLAQDKGLVNF